MRKKQSEMTPIEKMDKAMKGMSWEEAEDVGVEILARCAALHAYARKDGNEYFARIMMRIADRGDEWAHEGNNPSVLAFAARGHELKKKHTESKI